MNDKYMCISCGNIITVMPNSIKPSFCPVCKGKILQKVSNESNPTYRFMVPWDMSEYYFKEKHGSSVHKRHQVSNANKVNGIMYF